MIKEHLYLRMILAEQDSLYLEMTKATGFFGGL